MGSAAKFKLVTFRVSESLCLKNKVGEELKKTAGTVL